MDTQLINELRLMLSDWKDQEEEAKQFAKDKPEYRQHFEGKVTAFSQHRIELEVLLTKLGKTYPTTIDG
ncbi:hypothetical protein [Vibrio sp. 1180_3]|uniref:hypothetical protein n=1 Tax=Vibrio sp. 1180_3 TaxID=2528832 RepID=UPI002406EC60|nr:hypothetical protein [Vibrio sp. 1180_3]MDF9399177.1 hypothetical protein [Vibrio sp. 1180_3]